MSQPVIRKIGPVTFEHHDEFKGDVKIMKGGVEVSVSVESLELLIAEKFRAEDIRDTMNAKPAELLRRRLRRIA